VEGNDFLYEQEIGFAEFLFRRNRHNSVTGEWYGPDPEPQPASESCRCGGCLARFRTW